MHKLALVTISLLISACGGNSAQPPLNISSADMSKVKKLNAQLRSWRGVKYAEGGNSKQGVDCSGFVHITYREQFRRQVPRTTERLLQTGEEVEMGELRPGDLVFFKTGWKTRHVGIYSGKGEFIHASSSRGVMKSKLTNPYWSDAYWMSRRI